MQEFETELNKPSVIHNEKVLNDLSDEFMYLHCIKFIKKIKTGGQFHATSPILNDISGVPNWTKVSGGMIKMFKVNSLR